MTGGLAAAAGLLWALAAVAPLCAQFGDEPEEVEGSATEPQRALTNAELQREMRSRLASDPAVADSLAERINRSSLGNKITGAYDQETRLKEIKAWIALDPDTAAGIAIGLAQDDAEASKRFESMIGKSVQTKLVPNPGSKKGIFGRLKKSGGDSRLLNKQAGEIQDEEQQELIKTMFEGKGSQSNRIITQEEHLKDDKLPPGAAGAAGGASVLNSGYYDRLGQGNLRGYSPQLQAMQSALNARRVPGAPKLIETGTLDYETLSYPKYSMRWDIANLEQRLRYERNFALARLLGQSFSHEELLDPQVEARLQTQATRQRISESAAGKGALSPRFARRQAALKRAALAVRDFDGVALPAKDPLKITRSLVISLGDKQKEAARWITVASLQEELQGLEISEGFLSPQLLAAVDACPVDAGSRASYKRRGEEFKARLLKVKANDEAAIKALESEAWLSQLGTVEQALAENAALRKNLSRNIETCLKAAFRLAATASGKPRWRELLDGYLKRFLPSTAYARRLIALDRERAVLVDVFMKIASGDLDAAHTILASHEPIGP